MALEQNMNAIVMIWIQKRGTLWSEVCTKLLDMHGSSQLTGIELESGWV